MPDWISPMQLSDKILIKQVTKLQSYEIRERIKDFFEKEVESPLNDEDELSEANDEWISI